MKKIFKAVFLALLYFLILNINVFAQDDISDEIKFDSSRLQSGFSAENSEDETQIDIEKKEKILLKDEINLDNLPKIDESIPKIENPETIEAETSMPKKAKKADYALKEEEIKKIEKEIQERLKITLHPIDLEEALCLALEYNYGIKIITQQKEISRWAFYQTVTKFLPDITYFFYTNKVNGEFVAGAVIPDSVNEVAISSAYTFLWDPFKSFKTIFKTKAAKKIYDSEKENVEFEKEKTIVETTELYYKLLQQKLNNEILTKNLKERQEQLKISTQRFDSGLGTKFDVLRAEAELARAEQLLIVSYNALRLAQASLANLIGIDVFTALYPVEEEIEKVNLVDKDIPIETLSESAMSFRPDILAARLRVKAAIDERRAAYSTYLPNIYMQGIVSDAGVASNSLRRGYQLGVFASYPGGTGLGTFGITEIKALDARYKEENLKMLNLQRDVQQDIINSFYDSKTAEARIKSATKEVESANEALRLSVLRFRSGIGLFVDVLQAQSIAIQARISLINVTIDYNISQARILFDSGVISFNNVVEGYRKGAKAKMP